MQPPNTLWVQTNLTAQQLIWLYGTQMFKFVFLSLQEITHILAFACWVNESHSDLVMFPSVSCNWIS